MGWPPLSLRPIDVTPVTSTKLISRAVFAALLGFAISIPALALEKRPLTLVTSKGEHQITVEVADSSDEQRTGLMFRRSLGEDEGMIFLYEREEDVSMWMKNTYIPLDMIFVRSNGTVLRIETDTEPFSERIISSGGKVLAVIEMKAGSAARLGLKPGDKVSYPAFR